jgi:hypothetical protein
MECTRHFLKYYSAVNRSEALTPALMWRDPEDTVLSETSGHRRTHTAGCHSQEVPRVTEPERQEEDGGARADVEWTELWFEDMEGSRDGRWGQRHSHVSELSTAPAGGSVNFVLHVSRRC